MRRVLLAVAAVVALAACEPPVPYAGGDGRKVFVVGDSLVAESAGLLDVPGARLAVDALHGSDIAWAADQLEAQLADRPDVAVIATGTNSWVGGWAADDRAAVSASPGSRATSTAPSGSPRPAGRGSS